jgi:hypothetical protein
MHGREVRVLGAFYRSQTVRQGVGGGEVVAQRQGNFLATHWEEGGRHSDGSQRRQCANRWWQCDLAVTEEGGDSAWAGPKWAVARGRPGCRVKWATKQGRQLGRCEGTKENQTSRQGVLVQIEGLEKWAT